MLKTILFIYLLSLSLIACKTQKPTSQQANAQSTNEQLDQSTSSQENMTASEESMIQSITFNSSTRLYAKKLLFTPTEIVSEKGNRGNQQKQQAAISTAEWRELTTLCSSFNMNNMSSYTSPSMDRARDLAMHSYMEIITEEGSHRSEKFDNNEAPAELKPLLDKMLALEQKYFAQK